jgi:hypothetical protein
MKNSFLLRFQESCVTKILDPQLGTQTVTRALMESRDSDLSPASYRAILHRANNDVIAERTSRSLPLILQAGTKTVTLNDGEGNDCDPGPRLLRAIPPCS